MAVEVAATSSPDYISMKKDLENQELESAGGVASPQIYSQLLALHLLHNEICQAKFLWKRIPQATKNTTPELAIIWAVGQKMWVRDFPGVYETLKKDWSEGIKPIMSAVLEATRERALALVAQAYSSINADEFASFMGMPTNEAVQTVTSRGWGADPQTKFITPRKPEPPADPVLPSEQHLSVLTDYVSFLEG